LATFLICGAGAMGKALVYDLTEFVAPERIIVLDSDSTHLDDIAGDQVEKGCGDLSDSAFVEPFIKRADIACGAASYKLNLGLTELAIACKTHFVDLGGNNDVVQSQFALFNEAKKAGVTIMPDCGLAPGTVSILAADGINRFRKTESVRIRVGGLPQDPQPPLHYALSFSAEGLLNEYREPSIALRSGRITSVPSLSQMEQLSFPPKFPELEAFHTSGGSATLPYTYEGKIDRLDYKTIRYAGHMDKVKLLFDLGLADEEPIQVDNVRISPDKVLRELLTARLPRNVPDVVIVFVEVIAADDEGKVTYYIEDYYNLAAGHSAMQRCTAYSAGIIMQMISEESIKVPGTIRLELGVNSGRFIQLLKERQIDVKVVTSS
jgi:lysine 6-dehydrogenase